MRYLKQLVIILAVSFLGELLHYLIPLPVPASIYGLVLMFLALCTGLIKLSAVRDTGKFLLDIMPVMFIPAAVGLVDSWGFLAPILLPVTVITVVTTVLVMGVAGLVSQGIIRAEGGGSGMKEMLTASAYFGVFLSLGCYMVGLWLKKETGLTVANPLLVAIVLVILVLLAGNIEYSAYYTGAKYLSWLLTPATVCLAIPLYEQLSQLKRHWKAVLAGIFAGSLASLGGILARAVLFGLTHEQYVTLLPKSITAAVGMGVSEELGGVVSVTTAVIAVTGVLGNIIAPAVCRVLRIREPVARGVAIGTASHAIGTVRAMEMGEVEGAMSGLSIAVAGVFTVAAASVFAMLW